MPGRLDGECIIVDDQAEASQIYNKGYFGTPQPGGSLRLNLVEAIYLTEAGKLEVFDKENPFGMEKLFRLGNKHVPNFEINYIVYRDMKQRGYVVKQAAPPVDFRILPRGGVPGKNPSKFWVLALSERGIFDVEKLMDIIENVKGVKKILLLAVVDEESDITYYRAKVIRPNGRISSNVKERVAEAIFMRDRAFVLDPVQAASIHNIEFFGKLVGPGLQLSLLETALLMERGLITVKSATTGKTINLEKLKKEARKSQPDLDLRLQVYKDLKKSGVLVKTGFKYGSHFRVYIGDPESNHAKYLVHAIPENYVGMWAEISRAVRLAHGVKKEILLAKQEGRENVKYLRLRRIRP